MSKRRLNQIIAAEKVVKQETTSKITEAHHISQKPALFNGFTKTYRPIDEKGESFPPESQNVQYKVSDMTKVLVDSMAALFDITATKDYANCGAKASVKIGDKVLVQDAPVTFLLFLEKQLDYIEKFIEKLPVLDTADVWIADSNAQLWRTEPTVAHRTKKVQKALVMYPATPEHPAQTQLITEDVLVGFWDQTKLSGAISASEKSKLLTRVSQLAKAVVDAREEANMSQAETVEVGKAIFDFIFE